MIKKIKENLKSNDYEYDLKVAIIRIFGIFLLFFIFYYSFNYFSNQNTSNYISAINELEIKYFENNSNGNIFSLNENIIVFGDAKIIMPNNMNQTIYLEITNFNLSEIILFEIFSSITYSGKDMIPVKNVSIINSTIKVYFQNGLNLDKYNYIIFLDNQSKIPFAFTEIKI